LSALTTSGKIDIAQNNSLASIAGLNSLQVINTQLRIQNPNLTSLAGLSRLTTINGDLTILGNSLPNLNGLSNLVTVTGTINISGNNSLTSFAGMTSLQTAGDLDISSNDVLNDLSSLVSLAAVNGRIYITNNAVLASLNGLQNIAPNSIQGLNIYNNPNLSLCEVNSICQYLHIGNIGPASIYDNATGCNSVGEVKAICGNICGNGIIGSLEGCDDGNSANGDGCSATCTLEPYWKCAGEPSVCIEVCPGGVIPGDLTLDSQIEIDLFSSEYPGCFALAGNMEIYGPAMDITNLSGLNNLTTVGGELQIHDNLNTGFIYLTGLNGLTNVGGLYIHHNNNLASLTGLNALTTVSGTGLRVEYNDNLTSLNGLGALTTISGGLSLQQLSLLNSVSALSALTTINGGMALAYTNQLQYLNGLNNLTTLNGGLSLRSNSYLQNLSGLSGLTGINGTVWIDGNGSLQNFSGLDNLTSITGNFLVNANGSLANLTGLNALNNISGYLYIRQNPLLTNLQGLNNLSSIGSTLWINENTGLLDLSGLNALTIVSDAVWIEDNAGLQNLTGLNALSSTSLGLRVRNNGALTSLSALSALSTIGGGDLRIENNDMLASLAGIDNINHTSIGSLWLQSSASLSVCDVASICNYLRNGGTSTISGNATGCNSQTEVRAACAVCGDGLIEGAEGCDDGNTDGGDGCGSTCAVEIYWQCSGQPSVCDGICGDGHVVGTELCDDGNNWSWDGCSSDCDVEDYWQCSGEPSFCDGICGDGFIRGSEGCDDGNTDDSDGCSNACTVEPGYSCTGEPSDCIPPTDYVFIGSGDWGTTANWDAEGIPPATLPSGSTIRINGSGNCELGSAYPILIEFGASFTVESGKTLLIGTGANISLAGSFMNNGTVSNSGNMVNSSADFIVSDMATFNNLGSLANIYDFGPLSKITIQAGGTFNNQTGSELSNYTTIENCGTFNNSGTFSSFGNITNCMGSTITNTADGEISCTSEITGGEVINNGGLIVGCSPGFMTINGNFSNNGGVFIELGGLTAGLDYDQLNITGTANLGGTLHVSFWNGFTPSVGQMFTILTYASRSGNFTTINIPCPGCWNFGYQAGALVLTLQQALPVELISFNGRRSGEQVLLSWATASELNNHGFDVQRSLDLKGWQSIDWVNGHGTSLSGHSYQLFDQRPFPGINYYRLRQVDFDQGQKYSAIIQVEMPDNRVLFDVFPNPNQGKFSCFLKIPNEVFYSLYITDVNGVIIRQQSGTGDNSTLDLSQAFDAVLPPGIYFVKLKTPNRHYVKRVVVQF
jgi:cysteine-rich repeat protein